MRAVVGSNSYTATFTANSGYEADIQLEMVPASIDAAMPRLGFLARVNPVE
jgi:hypothetical protein